MSDVIFDRRRYVIVSQLPVEIRKRVMGVMVEATDPLAEWQIAARVGTAGRKLGVQLSRLIAEGMIERHHDGRLALVGKES